MISINALGARFGWRCHLCGRKVHQDLKPPHPGAPTRDHIIPKSRGGSDRIANMALAHFLCNQVRANGGLKAINDDMARVQMQATLAKILSQNIATNYDAKKLQKIRSPKRKRRR